MNAIILLLGDWLGLALAVAALGLWVLAGLALWFAIGPKPIGPLLRAVCTFALLAAGTVAYLFGLAAYWLLAPL